MKRFGTLDMAATWTKVGPLFGAGASDPNGGKQKRALVKEAEKTLGKSAGESLRKMIHRQFKGPLSKEEVVGIGGRIAELKLKKDAKKKEDKAANKGENSSSESSAEDDTDESGAGLESSNEDSAEELAIPSGDE